MRQKITMAIFMSILLLCFIGCSQVGKIEIQKATSSYSDFWIEKDKVYIKYELTIKNTGSAKQKVKMTADFDEDKKAGLLKESHLVGYEENLHSNEFTIKSGTNNDVAVVFIGEFAGNNQKQDRVLPKINIERVN